VREQKQLEITRIQAKQAVVVAVITAASTIAVTLLAERSLDRVSDRAPVAAEVSGEKGSAPLIFVASVDPGKARASAEQCRRKAGEEMRARRGSPCCSGRVGIPQPSLQCASTPPLARADVTSSPSTVRPTLAPSGDSHAALSHGVRVLDTTGSRMRRTQSPTWHATQGISTNCEKNCPFS
jgi:hypothetical protein